MQAVSTTTAGLGTISNNIKNGSAVFSEKLTFNLINASGRALTNTVINGGNMTAPGARVNYTQSDIARLETQLRDLSPHHQLIYSQPSTTLSPMPASYVNMSTAVNMNNVVGASSTNAFGFNRDGPKYFNLLLQQQPQMFSQQNRDAVMNGRAPTVDPQWIQLNPTHRSFERQILVHHHWMQGNIAVAIPQPVHQNWNRTFHPYR